MRSNESKPTVRAASVLHALGLAAAATCALAPPAASAQSTSLELPASFRGTLPCNDCEGVRAQLDLWPDGVFHLQREFVGKPGRDDDRGRWRRDPSRALILLYGGRPMPLEFEIVGPRTLRLAAPAQAANAGRYDLVGLGALSPAELNLALHGMFRYMADAARFEECLTGRSYPVAMEGDFVALQRAYLGARAEPGAPLMATFDGRIALRSPMEGPSPVATIVVDRFVGVWPGQTCERAMSRASLTDQYWRMVKLNGQPVVTPSGQREAHVVLRGGKGSYAGNIACTRFSGSYRVDGPVLRLQRPTPGAPAACPAADVAAETSARAWYDVLEATRRWSINAQIMEWFDEQGRAAAVFEAVYLR